MLVITVGWAEGWDWSTNCITHEPTFRSPMKAIFFE
jgi:hypothetical protein